MEGKLDSLPIPVILKMPEGQKESRNRHRQFDPPVAISRKTRIIIPGLTTAKRGCVNQNHTGIRSIQYIVHPRI